MNNDNTTTQKGERLTFRQLLDEKNYKIQIPIIQRDYAQGRPSNREVRELFLNAIKTYLDENIPNRDLDFVYGSLSDENEGSSLKFIPLDGQQRLTTLFLLHWYLSVKDNRSDDFRMIAAVGFKSKFSYETRTSSRDFCDALLNCQINIAELLPADEDKDNSLSKTIKDCNWYFLSWDNDSTVKSMLVMLDAIHNKFKATVNYYERLVDVDNPIITFQFLNLKEFKLTDDLYVKMNARGKPLTDFENFKARFEQLIASTTFTNAPEYKISYAGIEKEVTVAEYFSNKIDTEWANLFWQHKDPKSHTYDRQIMNLICVLSINHLAFKDNNTDLLGIKYLLKRKNDALTYNTFNFWDCFDEDFILHLIVLLDMLKNGDDSVKCFLEDSSHYDERFNFVNHIYWAYNDSAFTARIQFYSYCQYIVYWKDSKGLYDWMRVVHNLTENTAPYNSELEFARAIRGIKKIIPFSNDILNYLQNDGEVTGFNPAQIIEEKIKASLILKDLDWSALIHNTEKELKYFKGQLTFLLSFSGIANYYNNNLNCIWDSEQNTIFKDRIVFYINKSKLIFNHEGLNKFDDFIWHRTLLCKGDYLIKEGQNHSFLIDSDRDISWKRLLLADKNGDEHKALYVKAIMDDPDFSNEDIVDGLNKIIEKSDIADWRKYFVLLPDLFRVLGPKRYIRCSDEYTNEIYLLTGERRNGKYYEYYTYAMYLACFYSVEFLPFADVSYYYVWGEDELPHIALENWYYKNAIFKIKIYYDSKYDQFKIIYSDLARTQEVPTEILDILENNELMLDNNIFSKYVSESNLMSFVQDLTSDFKNLQL